MVWGYNMSVITPETLPPILDYIREKRNALLKASDWTQAADSPLSDEKKAEWVKNLVLKRNEYNVILNRDFFRE